MLMFYFVYFFGIRCHNTVCTNVRVMMHVYYIREGTTASFVVVVVEEEETALGGGGVPR